ncbi:DUF7344 domain-containing protein [Halorussus salinus]|uniref:DUF7344 domain-containing protein n=1 Tax=Halorussus salinus TaxID=1364935 RepID=UPI0010929E82|nr:hypothetical protein [Halorussus salinus]
MDRTRTDSTDGSNAPTDEPLPDDLHWVLTDESRRAALATLRERESATLAELAEAVARTGDQPADRVLVSLDRHHLPLMVEAGLLDYDESSERVALADLSAESRERIDRTVPDGDEASVGDGDRE